MVKVRIKMLRNIFNFFLTSNLFYTIYYSLFKTCINNNINYKLMLIIFPIYRYYHFFLSVPIIDTNFNSNHRRE